MAAIGAGRRRCRDKNNNRADCSRCCLVQPNLTCHAQLVTKTPSTPHVQHSAQAMSIQESAALNDSYGRLLWQHIGMIWHKQQEHTGWLKPQET